MAESLEKLLKQALVKRGADKADAAVAALGMTCPRFPLTCER